MGPEILIAATLASSAVSAVGQVQAMNAQASAADYSAKIADRDAYVATQNRDDTLLQTRIAGEDQRRDNKRQLASIRAAYGSSGVELAGSPLDVLQDSATELELDARRGEYEGQVSARETELQALGLNESAGSLRTEARANRRAAPLAAVGTLVGGAGTALSRMK